MPQQEIYLKPDFYYHIYNRGVGNENIFYSEANYLYFLKKYHEYIYPVAETYSYCLMPNHFHFLVKIREVVEIRDLLKDKQLDYTIENDLLSLFVSRQFSHLFNGYSQAINKQQSRYGSLFSRPFKRKEIGSMDYLRNLVLYIHLNPVSHGIVTKLNEWKYSSYKAIISNSEFKLKKSEVINWFEDLDNLIQTHENYNLSNLAKIKMEIDG